MINPNKCYNDSGVFGLTFKGTAAQLAANELETDLTEFRMDSSWTKTNAAFLLAWTTKSLDLDAVSAHPLSDSQKHLWFT